MNNEVFFTGNEVDSDLYFGFNSDKNINNSTDFEDSSAPDF